MKDGMAMIPREIAEELARFLGQQPEGVWTHETTIAKYWGGEEVEEARVALKEALK